MEKGDSITNGIDINRQFYPQDCLKVGFLRNKNTKAILHAKINSHHVDSRVLAKAKEQNTLRELSDYDDIILTLRNGCCNLETILANILDYSKYDAGIPVHPQYETVNVKDLLENLVDSVRFTAAERQVRVGMHYPCHVPEWLVIDQVKLTQILTNITNNAIKFTRQCSRVEISVDADSDTWVVTIKDEGPGIPMDKMRSLFDLFVAERSLANAKGVGL